MATPKNHSVEKAFALLRQFRSRDEDVTAAELSRRAGLPEASGHRLVATLVDVGAVVRLASGRYRLGLMLPCPTCNGPANHLLPHVAHSVLCSLADSLRLTVHMGVFEEGMVTYIAKVGSSLQVSRHTKVGAQLEAYCSALGKALLAGLPQEAFDEFLLDGDFVALTSHTITDKAAFSREIATVREQGFAVDDREMIENQRCVATPLRDANGAVVAAISVSDEADRLNPARQAEIVSALRKATDSIAKVVYPPIAISGKATRGGVLIPN